MKLSVFSNRLALPLSLVPKSGWALLFLLVALTGLSILLLHWYQNEIQFRLQAEASLRYQLIFPQVEGVLAESILLLQNYSETQLRSDAIKLSSAEFASFFSGWTIQSKAAQDAPFLKLTIQHQSFEDPLAFEALFRFDPYHLSDIPWINLAPEPAQTFPSHLIFSREEDQFLSLQAARYPLQAETPLDTFHYVF